MHNQTVNHSKITYTKSVNHERKYKCKIVDVGGKKLTEFENDTIFKLVQNIVYKYNFKVCPGDRKYKEYFEIKNPHNNNNHNKGSSVNSRYITNFNEDDIISSKEDIQD